MAVLLGVLCAAASAEAQPIGPEGTYFFSVGFGVQPQARSFGTSSTFQSFLETGTVKTTQDIDRGLLLDISTGYQFSSHLGIGVGLWGARSDGGASAVVQMPDQLFFNRFTTINLAAGGMAQSLVGLDFQLLFRYGLGSRVDVTFSLGPTLIYTKQKVGAVAVAANTSTATLGGRTESKITAKAGNAGVDVSTRVAGDYSIGVFARYAGGETDLPSAPKLRVGGTQIGANMRWRF